MNYAIGTSVPVERSRNEIAGLLVKAGSTKFAYATEPGRSAIQFEYRGGLYRMVVALPSIDEFRYTPANRIRSAAEQVKMQDQAHRSRWRALALMVKAAIVAVDSGSVTPEQAFGGYFVLPNGRTAADELRLAVEEKRVPAIEFIPGGGG